MGQHRVSVSKRDQHEMEKEGEDNSGSCSSLLMPLCYYWAAFCHLIMFGDIPSGGQVPGKLQIRRVINQEEPEAASGTGQAVGDAKPALAT